MHVSAPSPKTGATRQSDTERESPRSPAREGACGRWNETDNAVPFAPQLCCPKSLTNSERAVVKGARIVDLATMKLSLLIAVCCTAALAANAQVNVTQKNNNPSRDGLYIDPAFTPGNAANLVRDLGFNGTIVGNVHAQPLYIEGGAERADDYCCYRIE